MAARLAGLMEIGRAGQGTPLVQASSIRVVEVEAYASVHDLIHSAVVENAGQASLREIYAACQSRGRIAYKRSGGSRLITQNDHWKSQIRHALYTSDRFKRVEENSDFWRMSAEYARAQPQTTSVLVRTDGDPAAFNPAPIEATSASVQTARSQQVQRRVTRSKNATNQDAAGVRPSSSAKGKRTRSTLALGHDQALTSADSAILTEDVADSAHTALGAINTRQQARVRQMGSAADVGAAISTLHADGDHDEFSEDESIHHVRPRQTRQTQVPIRLSPVATRGLNRMRSMHQDFEQVRQQQQSNRRGVAANGQEQGLTLRWGSTGFRGSLNFAEGELASHSSPTHNTDRDMAAHTRALSVEAESPPGTQCYNLRSRDGSLRPAQHPSGSNHSREDDEQLSMRNVQAMPLKKRLKAAAQAAAAHDRGVRGSFAVPASRAPSLEETLTATHHSMLASGFMSINPSVHPSESPSVARRWGNMSAGEPSFSALYKQGDPTIGMVDGTSARHSVPPFPRSAQHPMPTSTPLTPGGLASYFSASSEACTPGCAGPMHGAMAAPAGHGSFEGRVLRSHTAGPSGAADDAHGSGQGMSF